MIIKIYQICKWEKLSQGQCKHYVSVGLDIDFRARCGVVLDHWWCIQQKEKYVYIRFTDNML